MPLELWLTTTVGAALLVPALLSQLFFWQRKEYRWDRISSYIRSAEGSLTRQPLLLGCMLIVGIGWLGFMVMMPFLGIAAGYVSLFALIAYHVLRIGKRGLLRPKLTQKVIVLVVVELVLLLTYLRVTYVSYEFTALQWSTLHLLLPLITALAVIITAIPTSIRKKQIIERASKIRKQATKVTVVGITGSYGKTSTKHFLTQLLAESDVKFAATKQHRNSHIGVAYDMLEQFSSKLNVYVAEMGAYTKGEIKDLAELTKPTIGVITAIGNQHLDLFGSKESIARAKWELLEALPADGKAILNADDPVLVECSKNYSGTIIWYSSTKKAEVYISSLNIKSRNISGVLHIGAASVKVDIPLVSRGLLSSALAAVSVAYALGLKKEVIASGLSFLYAFERTMEIREGLQKSTVIDDSYSGGEAAAKNAINHLSLFRRKDKRIVFIPIIELGMEGSRVHQELGALLGKSGAQVFIYGDLYKEELQAGFNSVNQLGSTIEWVNDPLLLVEKVTSSLSSDTLLLLEGRTPDILRKTLFN